MSYYGILLRVWQLGGMLSTNRLQFGWFGLWQDHGLSYFCLNKSLVEFWFQNRSDICYGG